MHQVIIIITSPEGSHNALFTNLLAASLSILADAVTHKKSITRHAKESHIPKILNACMCVNNSQMIVIGYAYIHIQIPRGHNSLVSNKNLYLRVKYEGEPDLITVVAIFTND